MECPKCNKPSKAMEMDLIRYVIKMSECRDCGNHRVGTFNHKGESVEVYEDGTIEVKKRAIQGLRIKITLEI